ncbi:MAG: hypothetical protein ACE37K_13310 [Planctomycetota bacterium]
MTNELAPPASPTPWPGTALAFALAGAAVLGLAEVYDAQRLMHLATWLVLGLVLLPLAFVAGLAGCAAILLALLGPLSLPARLTGRPVGLGGVARALGELVGGILPGYWRALRAVQKPWLWAAAAGFVVGIVMRMAWFGLGPA